VNKEGDMKSNRREQAERAGDFVNVPKSDTERIVRSWKRN